MLLVPWLLPLLSLLVNRAFAYDDTLVRLIGDGVGLLMPAVRVSAHLCRLNEDQMIALSRLMSSHGLTHQIHRNLNEFVSRSHDTWDHRVLYVLDLDCEYAVALLREANATGMLAAPIKWLLLQDRSTLLDNTTENREPFHDVAKTIERMAVYPDSEVILARKHPQDFTEITSIYRISRYHAATIEDRGNWTSDAGLLLKDFHATSRRRRNLQQTPLVSCIVMSDPDTINHLTDFEYKHVDAITKTNYPWMLHIVNRMNATRARSINENEAWDAEPVDLSTEGQAVIGQSGDKTIILGDHQEFDCGTIDE